jgi:hypothetical protein
MNGDKNASSAAVRARARRHPPVNAAARPTDMYLRDVVTLAKGDGTFDRFEELTRLLHDTLQNLGWELVDQLQDKIENPTAVTNVWKLSDSNALVNGINGARSNLEFPDLARAAIDSEEQNLLEPLDRELGGQLTAAGSAGTMILSQEFTFDIVDPNLKQLARDLILKMRQHGWKLAGWGNYFTGRPGRYLIEWDVGDQETLDAGRAAIKDDPKFKQLDERIVKYVESIQYRVPEAVRGVALSPQNKPQD